MVFFPLFNKASDAPKVDEEGYPLPTGISEAVKFAFSTIGFAAEHLKQQQDSKTTAESTLLHQAVERGEIDSVTSFLKLGAQINAQDAMGHTPLYRAVAGCHEEIATLLMAQGARVDLTSLTGETILHAAAQNKHPTLLADLLAQEACKRLIHAQDVLGHTALHKAVKQDNVKGVILLLEAGADTCIRNRTGEMPFDIAIRCGNNHVILSALKKEKTVLKEGLTDNLKEAYSTCLFQAVEQDLKHEQVLYFVKLGDLYIKEKDLISAAKCFNCALAITKDHLPTIFFESYLFAKLQDIERIFLKNLEHEIDTVDFRQNIKNFHELTNNQISSYRARLKTLRSQCHADFLKGKPIEAILTQLTDSFKDTLTLLISDAQVFLGPPPCTWACMGLGSMARSEMSYFSDIEYVFVCEKNDPKSMDYFRRLAQFLELKIINLGETSYSLFQGGSSPTPTGFSQDTAGHTPLGVKGLYELIGTPQTLAQFQTETWLNNNIIVVNTMNTVCFVCGTEQLVTEYRKQKDSMLQNDSFRTILAEQLFKGDLDEFEPALDFSKEEMRAFGIKREVYRPFQGLINSLAILYALPEGSTLSRVEALAKKGVFSLEGASNLKKAIRLVFNLRLNAHFFYQTEKEVIFHQPQTVSAKQNDKLLYFNDTSRDMLTQIYKTLLPFYRRSKAFATKKSTFEGDVFLEKNMKVQGDTLYAEQRYQEAYKAYQQAMTLDPHDPAILKRLTVLEEALEVGNPLAHHKKRMQFSLDSFASLAPSSERPEVALFNMLCRNPQDIEQSKEVLKIRQMLYGEVHPRTVEGYSSLGSVLKTHGKYEESIAAYQKAFKSALAIERTYLFEEENSSEEEYFSEAKGSEGPMKKLIGRILNDLSTLKDSKSEHLIQSMKSIMYADCLRILGPNDTDFKRFFLGAKGGLTVLRVGLPSPTASNTLSPQEMDYIQQLAALPLESILDRGMGERTCKNIGQAIFDSYKQDSLGKSLAKGPDVKRKISEAGKAAVQKICDALPSQCTDGRLRKQYVERAWDGVGDAHWQWRA